MPKASVAADEAEPASAAASPLPAPLEAAAASAFVFHHANAYESKDGEQLILDSVAYPRFPGFFEVSHCTYHMPLWCSA